VPLAAATEYAAEDADICLRLWLRLKPRIAAEVPLKSMRWSTGSCRDRRRMERRGIKVDRDYLARLSGTFATEIAALEQRVYEAAQGPFTIGSPQQLGQVLFDRLGLKGGRKGKSGQYSTDVNELERLAAEGVPVARLVLDWAQLTKLKSTYTDALQAQINRERDGSTPVTACRAHRPDGWPRPSQICRTFPFALRSAGRFATPSWRNPDMC